MMSVILLHRREVLNEVSYEYTFMIINGRKVNKA